MGVAKWITKDYDAFGSALANLILMKSLCLEKYLVSLLFTGGTTSPDFVYVINTEDGKVVMNFNVETKDINDDIVVMIKGYR